MAEIMRMETESGDGIQLKKYQEVIVTNAFNVDPEKIIENSKSFKYRVGDIIVCSYLKCGTHWMGSMIGKLKSWDFPVQPVDAVPGHTPTEVLEDMKSPRILFTHLRPGRLPTEHIEKQGKIVLMLRNPKDVMVSYYYSLKNAVYFKNKQTWDDFFQSFVSGIIPYGSYFDYIQEWEQVLLEKASGNSSIEVELFFYEDFQVDCKNNLMRLNRYLGFDRNDEYIDKVLKETTLDSLKRQDAIHHKNIRKGLCDKTAVSIIYRKGKVGDWKKHLTAKQSQEIDKLVGEKLQGGIITFKYDI